MRKTNLLSIFLIFLIAGFVRPCFAVVIPNTGSVNEKTAVENTGEQIKEIDKALENMEKKDSVFLEMLKLKMNDGNTGKKIILQEVINQEESNINEIRSLRKGLISARINESETNEWEIIYWIVFAVICIFVAGIVISVMRKK